MAALRTGTSRSFRVTARHELMSLTVETLSRSCQRKQTRPSWRIIGTRLSWLRRCRVFKVLSSWKLSKIDVYREGLFDDSGY